MSSYETSIIIPVFNKWELTRGCLKSLAETINPDNIEVIVIDNASTDCTAQACLFLGQTLFGTSFKFIHNDQNRNFAVASNQGAEAANGKFLLFLNNDTKAINGWYEPLLADFQRFPSIAATGPILLYPDHGPFGRLVQHLGVLVSPFLKFGHLYQGIPEASILAQKRRFFQAITAACMMIPRALFFKAGKFDEQFVNGFEDVDLCGRLCSLGYNFSINPEAKFIHYESQTPGRGANDADNFAHLQDKSLKYFKPDWDRLIKADNLCLSLNEWLYLYTRPVEHKKKELDELLANLDRETIKSILMNIIYWEKGWKKYLDLLTDKNEYLKIFAYYIRFYKTIPNAGKAILLGRKYHDRQLEDFGQGILKSFQSSPEAMLENAKKANSWFIHLHLDFLASEYAKWIDNFDIFITETYPEYQKKYFSLLY